MPQPLQVRITSAYKPGQEWLEAAECCGVIN